MRGFVLATLCGGATLNRSPRCSDWTAPSHRTVKSLIREGLVSERKAPSGRALFLQLTAKGNRYRSVLIQQRRAVDAKLRRRLSPRQFTALIRQLEVLSGLHF
jgi:DNA-binding MarR family transcriptional regulator